MRASEESSLGAEERRAGNWWLHGEKQQRLPYENKREGVKGDVYKHTIRRQRPDQDHQTSHQAPAAAKWQQTVLFANSSLPLNVGHWQPGAASL